MDPELTLGLAFLAGLAGAGHCWAMCGGLVGGLFLGCGRCAGGWAHAGYHLGRVLGYSAIGALAAGLGQAVVLTGAVGRGQGGLYVLAGLAVVGAGLWLVFRPFPQAGPARRAQDATPVASPRDARVGFWPTEGRGVGDTLRIPVVSKMKWPRMTLSPAPLPLAGEGGKVPFLLAGLFNAVMPCALVYSLAVKAMTAPSVAQGAAWLFAFGLGTVPAMAVAGVLAHALSVQSLAWLRRAGALLVIALGIQAIWAGAEFFRVMGHLA